MDNILGQFDVVVDKMWTILCCNKQMFGAFSVLFFPYVVHSVDKIKNFLIDIYIN